MTNPQWLYLDILYLIDACNVVRTNTGLATDVSYFSAGYASEKTDGSTIKESIKCLKGSK